MKKFTEILDDIRKVQAELRAAKEHGETLQKELSAKIRENYTKKQRNEYTMQIDECKKKVTVNSEKVTDLALTLQIMQNNAKIAIYNEVTPVAIEVLNKYIGKAYGEKTKQKISDEIAERTHFRCYICSEYASQSLDFCPCEFYAYKYDISVGVKNDTPKRILLDNKIQKISFDEFELWYIKDEYIEHIQERVLDLKAAYSQAAHTREEFKKACEKFNTLAVGDIKHIQVDDPYFYGIV